MSKSSSARVDFARKVKNGDYTLEQAEKELDRMEESYGEEAFLAGSVVRKEPPWTMKDLEKLNMEVTAGAGSRELLHYMAEVSDAVYSKKRRMKFSAQPGAKTGVGTAAGELSERQERRPAGRAGCRLQMFECDSAGGDSSPSPPSE